MRTLHVLPATLAVVTPRKYARSCSRTQRQQYEVSYARTRYSVCAAPTRVLIMRELTTNALTASVVVFLPPRLSIAGPHHAFFRRGSHCRAWVRIF